MATATHVPTLLAARTLDLPPSCAEFCPAHPALLVVGTYVLEERADAPPGDDVPPQPPRPQERSGSLTVWRVDGGRAGAAAAVTLVQTRPQPTAVLDLHFHPADARGDVLATACNGAGLGLFRVHSTPDGGAALHVLAELRVPALPPDALLLAVAWHPGADDTLAVAASTGAVVLVNVAWAADAAAPVALRSVAEVAALRNGLEAWSVAFGPGVVLSGGDDGTLRCAADPLQMATTHEHLHDAGVTAILPLRADEPALVATGSYDGRLRVLRVPPSGPARVLAEADLGGGVWRLRAVGRGAADGDEAGVRVLASCMHAGACVVDIEPEGGGGWRIVVRARFSQHESMNYASDAQPGPGPLRCVSTSFYDRRLCLWQVEL